MDLNCAAVPSSLLESELFGYERGAFTGAANEKPGLVEVADGGTLFLDEVGEMIPEIQSKFLRVLDSGTFYRVGATRKRRADFRLVCATNRDLKGEVAAGRFRKDLFFRVNGVKVVIPPLRERPEDIPLLVEHFVKQLPNQKRFTPAALEALSRATTGRATSASCTSRWSARASWPRATRSTSRTCRRRSSRRRGGCRSRSRSAAPSIAPASAARPAGRPATTPRTGPASARVQAALEQAKWRREKAAEILGVSPRTLYRWIKRLGLERSKEREAVSTMGWSSRAGTGGADTASPVPSFP